MANIGIYYGSDTGNTQTVAEQIGKALGVEKKDIHDVASATADFSAYDVVLFGSPTMGFGDLQDDWEGFIEKVEAADLSGKKAGIFGCGDSGSYPDTFCDAIGKIFQAAQQAGAEIIGKVSTDGYSFDESEAVVDGQFVGLPIDEDNESDQTPARIAGWVEQIKSAV